jgi:hypothetical protein
MTSKIGLLAGPLGLGLGLAAAVAVAGEPAPGGKDAGRGEQHTRVIVVEGPGGGRHGPMTRLHGHMLKLMDENGDGVVTREEFRAAHDAMFDRLDTNRDGKLDKAEFEAHRPPMRPTPPAPPIPGMAEMHDLPVGAHEVRVERIARSGDELDLDHDGKVSFEEFAAPLKQAFDEADKDRSGLLEQGEQAGERRIVTVRKVERDGAGEATGG